MFKIILLISLGGAFGAPLRYILNLSVNNIFKYSFPTGTLVVNILGSFAMGILAMSLKNYHYFNEDIIKYFFMIGFLGSFTTFSSFSIEVVNMIESHNYFYAILYILLSLLLNVLAALAGFNYLRLF